MADTRKKLKIALFSEDFSRKAKGTALFIQNLAEQYLNNYSDQIELVLIRKEGPCTHPLAARMRNIEIKVYKAPVFSTLISYLIFFIKNREEFGAVIFNRNVYPGFWLLNAKKFILFQYDAPVNAAYSVKMGWDIKLIDLFLKYAGKYFLDAIIAVSKNARREIIDYYRADPDKVFSVYCGVGEDFRRFSEAEKESQRDFFRKKYGISVPYILDVSRLDPHKNIHALIEVFLILKNQRRLPHKLVIVGGRHLPEYTKMIEEKIAEKGLEKEVVIAPYIEGADMPALYNLADLLVYPSLLEGFGLPIAEAMKCGTPAVASDIPVHKEISAGAALLTDPRNAGLLAHKILEALENKKLREKLIAAGLERSKIFSWEKTAEEMIKILKNLI